MMMVPYMFNDDLMDDLFNDNWERDFDRAMHSMQPRHMFGKRSANVMKTDVRETKDGYDVFVDLPGFKKEDIHLDLDDDSLVISAERRSENDEKDEKGNYIRRERSFGSFSRSFDVSGIRQDQIKASFENGVLKLTMPKKEAALSSARRLEIE